MSDDANPRGCEPKTGAEALLTGLKTSGVDYLFANAGTDFPPIIEALATLPPGQVAEALTIPHETASVAMAHGYYLVTGRPQAVMVHVNVGLANAAMGVINAASDNVPVVVMSGRTPITERGRPGHRVTPIHYGQEMYDQASLVSDVTKFHYELRYPEQGASLAARAVSLANSEPKGPVYLSLPREPLMEVIETQPLPKSPPPPTTAAHPDPDALAVVAGWIAEAEAPLVLCQRGDPAGRLGEALSAFCNRHGIGVAEPFPLRNVMATNDDAFLGYDVKAAMEGADVVVVLDAGIPWLEAFHAPDEGVKVVHIGADPHFARMPVRSYRCDLAIAADPVAAVEALSAVMKDPDERSRSRREKVSARAQAWRAKALSEAKTGCTTPMTAEWMSRCLSDALDDTAVVFGELGFVPGSMTLAGANRAFNPPHSGGLGWALPAALGAQLADRTRMVVACIGDGSYIFANPVACHQIAEALELPILTIIKNNGMWNAVRRSVINSYPQGAAARANAMPLTSLEPAPDYLKVAEASRAYTERVENGQDLPAALARAMAVIRDERRQAVLDVRVAVSDRN
ncbi:thiamine pyrophosphate-requiring protein [Amorphus orientalis]|uniref:Acetolactate synthase-1/2/3 large subunit n=1 Tax=Amorphus orientalis TaxID=649198 RepID=A0AAE3VM92_9HYPH|nr:thiamine pyrophosphate-requiring protein [Amorphus orientalis]MDQ0314555.1 acetolactate synthase-1/2/3 large subunit [Amorphus orientalis]